MRGHVRADINIEVAPCLISRLVYILLFSGRFLETMRKTRLLETARSRTGGFSEIQVNLKGSFT